MRIVIFGLRLGLGIGVSRHRGESAALGGRIGSVLRCFPYISPCHITLLLAVSCRPSTVGAMTFADPQSSSGRESEAVRQAMALTSKDNNAVSATAVRREPEPSGNASLRADPWKALARAEIEAFNAMSRDQVRRVREAAGDAAWQRRLRDGHVAVQGGSKSRAQATHPGLSCPVKPEPARPSPAGLTAESGPVVR